MKPIILTRRTLIQGFDCYLIFRSTCIELSASDTSSPTTQPKFFWAAVHWTLDGFAELIAFLSFLKQGLDVINSVGSQPTQGALSPEDFYKLEKNVYSCDWNYYECTFLTIDWCHHHPWTCSSLDLSWIPHFNLTLLVALHFKSTVFQTLFKRDVG